MNFRIFTDTGCDIPADLLQQWNMTCVNLTFHDEKAGKTYVTEDISIHDFYQQMRDGTVFKTAAANVEDFRMAFESALADGQDILYLGFSSGLSATCNFAREAAEEIMSEYEGSKVVVVDTLCASAGYGLLLKLSVDKKAAGATIDEVASFAEDTKLKVCHWFTVDDLKYLKAGGRISATTALVGGMLNIKPVMKMDNNGKLISVSKVRGRKAALKAIADLYAETALDKKDGVVFISHGDCIDDANQLADMLKENSGATVQVTTYVGPVIGSHSGPGTLALFFLANER